MRSAQVIAEIGCNHKGDMAIAREMIRTAARFCQVDAVKFQKRNVTELLSSEQAAAPHENPRHAYGATYGEHRDALEFTAAQHAELMQFCADEGITYSTSVWDLTSARDMAALNPAFLKIPSASNLHFEMQAWLCQNYAGQVHVSTGMSTRQEVEEIVGFYEAQGRARDLVLYACTSGYPVEFDQLCLLDIQRLREAYGQRVGAIGFSGHHLGIAADIAALALGASWIERHFTLDRTWKGTDHAASLEPDGMRRLKRDVHNIGLALTHKPDGLLEVEQPQRRKLKWQAH